MPRPLGWLRARMGVRAVSALSAAVVVALALAVAGVALVLLVQQSLRQQVQAEARAQAQVIVDRLEGNWRGQANENARDALDQLIRESDLAQVRVEYGDDPPTWTTEAGTDAVGRDVLMSDVRPADGETVVQSGVPVRKVDGSVVDTVLVATGADSGRNDVILLYAAPLTAVEAATRTLLFYLLWGVPLLIVVTGVTTYLFSGRALRPVEAMRGQVAAMTEKDLGQRVPVPPARDEVGRLAETMNAMLARLEDAQGVQRRFVADASHELRSPLATIATGLELMQNGTVDGSTVTALRGEAARLNNLVEGLILLARADERGLQPRREEVDLDEVAELERGRPADGVVVAEVRAVPVRVIGDRGQLARVVRNLVDNARRHARSRVLVTVGRDGDTAVLEVSDDGAGVPESDRARVFERFVRLDDARARTDGGSGLGLAIVAEVVAAHGGTVEVTDGPDGGALFRVRIPAAAAPDAQPEEVPRAEAVSRPDPKTVGQAAVATAAPVPPPPPTKRTASGNGWFAAPARPTEPAWTGDEAWTGEAAWGHVPGQVQGPPRRARRGPRPVQPGREPVRDEEARRDPVTAPSGIPVVPPEEPKPASRSGRIPSPRPQPGSAMR
ncbi:signal transduction histidine kinase [Pseudonocardia hierapolitana]|uniref:histidine kinase n=1 Tax=Pseudonocardia hierapolitana TaxID=1128676 RepID=A0A561SSI7_9PSEU|nr:HAMP domain-containing sensor histidine kinase [Pseudonocardia hierapolitana]TWF77829.1 signal transduction histidine kinase [Pseudonocardia hierapolitana]